MQYQMQWNFTITCQSLSQFMQYPIHAQITTISLEIMRWIPIEWRKTGLRLTEGVTRMLTWISKTLFADNFDEDQSNRPTDNFGDFFGAIEDCPNEKSTNFIKEILCSNQRWTVALNRGKPLHQFFTEFMANNISVSPPQR